MTIFPIEKFGTKLLVSSKSPNKIPYEYLKEAFNCRIFDGGIGPRRGKTLITDSILGTVNQGAFFLNDTMYQIMNSKIYEVNQKTGVQTEITTLGYDKRTDILVYNFPKGAFINSYSKNTTYTLNRGDVGSRWVYNGANELLINEFIPSGGYYDLSDSVSGDGSTTGKVIPAIKILGGATDASIFVGAGGGTQVGSDIILTLGQYLDANSTGNTTNNISVQFGFYESEQRAIIVADNGSINVFDGKTIVNTQTIDNSGIIEFTRGFSFLAQDNNLLISSPVTANNPERAYDFTSGTSQSILYDKKILGLKSTMNGLYVWTEDKVEFLGANSLQNIAGSATFISTPLGVSGPLLNNHCIATIGDKIFYLTKDLNVQTINYIGGTDSTSVGELSSRPIIGIKEFLNTVDVNNEYSFGIQNKKDKTVQFHIRTTKSQFNDITLIYDFINDTWSLDTQKNYNWVLQKDNKLFGFSDINTSVFVDDEGFSDAGNAIPFSIKTQDMNMGSNSQKLFNGLFTAGTLSSLTNLNYKMEVDSGIVFNQDITGTATITEGISSFGEIGTEAIGISPIGGSSVQQVPILPFDKVADSGRIFKSGNRAGIHISSESLVQEFLIDTLGISYEATNYTDINNKW